MDAPTEPHKTSETPSEDGAEWRLKDKQEDKEANWKGGETAGEKQDEERSGERGWGMANEGEKASDESE